jgi:hypothetical protein
MSRETLETICKFCVDKGLVLLADEVYQRNVYAEDKEFLSVREQSEGAERSAFAKGGARGVSSRQPPSFASLHAPKGGLLLARSLRSAAIK